MKLLEGKTALITGASRGIGKAIALRFAREGSDIAITNIVDDEEFKTTLKEITALGVKAKGYVSNAASYEDSQHVINDVVKDFTRIDILINNAGLGSYDDFMDLTEADWRTIFEINLFAPVFLTQLVLATMKKQKSGIIVNVASIAGLFAHMEKVSSYVASKHAMVGFCRGLQKDLPGSGISVYAVCPGYTDTEFFDSSPLLEPIVSKSRKYMESPETVARGIIDQLDSQKLIIFPTQKAAKLYDKQHDQV